MTGILPSLSIVPSPGMAAGQGALATLASTIDCFISNRFNFIESEEINAECFDKSVRQVLLQKSL